ncbi:hypothetical protein PF003_g18469 [Phytophthora fragariae]|nr:hypothetical protein PF003_g18469 [Phytophthora fragariae]
MGRHRNQLNLSPDRKLAVLVYLSSKAVNDKLPRGVKAEASRKFACHRQTITSIWNQRKTPQVLTARARRRPRGLRYPDVVTQVESVPLPLRQTQRSLAAALGIPRSTLQRYV